MSHKQVSQIIIIFFIIELQKLPPIDILIVNRVSIKKTLRIWYQISVVIVCIATVDVFCGPAVKVVVGDLSLVHSQVCQAEQYCSPKSHGLFEDMCPNPNVFS